MLPFMMQLTISLAIQGNGTFITADKIYFDKAKKKGILDF